jgi:hypothetical protein
MISFKKAESKSYYILKDNFLLILYLFKQNLRLKFAVESYIFSTFDLIESYYQKISYYKLIQLNKLDHLKILIFHFFKNHFIDLKIVCELLFLVFFLKLENLINTFSSVNVYRTRLFIYTDYF